MQINHPLTVYLHYHRLLLVKMLTQHQKYNIHVYPTSYTVLQVSMTHMIPSLELMGKYIHYNIICHMANKCCMHNFSSTQ